MVRESCINEVHEKLVSYEQFGRCTKDQVPGREAVARVLHALTECGYRVTLDVGAPVPAVQAGVNTGPGFTKGHLGGMPFGGGHL